MQVALRLDYLTQARIKSLLNEQDDEQEEGAVGSVIVYQRCSYWMGLLNVHALPVSLSLSLSLTHRYHHTV